MLGLSVWQRVFAKQVKPTCRTFRTLIWGWPHDCRPRSCSVPSQGGGDPRREGAGDPSETLPKLADLGLVEVIDVPKLIGETIADIDRAGRPWPRDYYASLPTAVLERLKTLMHNVEAAALADDINATAEGLAKYRAELLRHLN